VQADKKIQVKVEKKPRCLVELEVSIGAELVKDARVQALKDVKKEITISGFRKGKAPDDVIIKKYPEALRDKWEKKIADLSFVEAHTQEKLPSLSTGGKIVFKIQDYSLEKGANISFSYETEPEVPTIDPKAFKLEEEEKAVVSQKEVDEAIRQVRFFYATWKEVDRPIKEGDYIIIDLDSLEEEKPQRIFNDTRFEVSDKGMTKWMQKLVLGAKKGDALKSISKPDAKPSKKEKEEFEERKVLVTIKKIEEATLPEIDDEFAKKIGANTTKEMSESIKKMLIQQAETTHNQENRQKVSKFLLDTYKFDVPDSLIKTEIEYRRNTYLKNPEFSKKYPKMNEKEKAAFEEEILKYSEAAIRIFYISKKIVGDFKIQITDDEIKQEALNILYRETGKKLDPKNISKDIYALALSKLVLIKAEDYLLDQTSKT